MDQTRERILRAALLAFAGRGYHAVGVQDVCEASGITKPTLYHHFGSKRGLLDALASERYGRFVDEVRDRGAYRGDVGASLVATLEVFLFWARSEPALSRLRLAAATSPPESEEHAVFRPHTARLYAVLRELFADAARDHGNMRGRDLPYAASFVGTADAYVALLLAGALDPDEGMVRRVVHHFMHGIFS